MDQYCEILVDRATERVQATDAFADWENKSKGNRSLSDTERLWLNDLEKEVARLRKENAQLLKAAKPNSPSTSASAVGNKGCFKCGSSTRRVTLSCQCRDPRYRFKGLVVVKCFPKKCFKCGMEGHRADQCPDNKPAPTKTAPATPRTSGAKSAGQSGKKVSFTKLQLDTAVKNTVQETVAAMEKKGWQKP